MSLRSSRRRTLRPHLSSTSPCPLPASTRQSRSRAAILKETKRIAVRPNARQLLNASARGNLRPSLL